MSDPEFQNIPFPWQRDFWKVKAAEMLNIPYEEVTEEQRREFKNRFWLMAYMSPPQPIAEILKDFDFAEMERRILAFQGLGRPPAE
jgi:hypothetical protein